MFIRYSGLRRAVHLLCVFGAATATSIIQAQTTAGETPREDATLDEVIVTGSRIARPNLESAVPVTTVSAEELYETGSTSVGDLLNDLPALRSTFSQSNSSRFLGTTGLNLLDLRGLGTQRTLVLVNGRRHVGADILGNAVSPDTNTFPTDLIERVDVVTGGNSAVYGSDAIGGVVNFILKKDFEGLQFRGQGGQTTSEHDAGNYYGSVLAGTNFWDDQGNIAVNFEYAKQEPFFASDRQNLRRQGLFVIDQADGDGAVNGSDGIPDRHYYGDVRNTSSDMGTIYINSPPGATSGPCGVDSGGTPYSCAFLFQPDGSLVPQTGQRIGLAPLGNFEGGNGTNNRSGKALAIYPELERYSFNVFGNLKVSDSFAPYIEAKYVRTNSIRFGSPAFFSGSTIDADRERPRFDNPFISDADRALINTARVAQGLAPATAATKLSFRKNLLDLGNREEDAKRETTRFVVGAGGELGAGWNYDVSVNWGQFKEATRVKGNLDNQKFLLAMDSVRTAGGQIVCRSQVDPAAAVGYGDFLDDGNTPEREPAAQFADDRLAGDIANCVPMNPFGSGNLTPAMKNYLLDDSTSVGKITEFVVNATITGDSSAWFSLPAGAVGVAFGLEHRTEENYFIADPVVRNGLTFYNALQTFDPPKFKVDEVFTEFRVPLLKEKTGAKDLTLNLAARYADYDGATGGVLAYNAGLEYAPIDSLRFRAGLARAVRAPSLADSFTALGQNFEPAPLDPCSQDNRGNGSPTRAANCAAAGIPDSYNYTYTASIEMRSGGNPELKEETSDSFTAGVIWQPEFLHGFSFSADYFDIKIDDVITAPTAQDIMNACYDAPTLDNQFCALFQRNGAGAGPLGEDPYQILQGSLQQITLNYASSKARGIDFEVGFAHDLGGAAKLSSRLVYTHMLQRDDFLNPAAPNQADQILMELGDPRDAFNLNTDVAIGKFKFGYQLRYISKMVLNFYEDTYSLQGNPPQNADYADVRYYGEVFYHDVRASYDFSDKLNAYLGVDNATNRIPPYGLTGTGAGSGIYEARGRFAYAGMKLAF
jgi:outer membrane receptor protein involved in Fe transport